MLNKEIVADMLKLQEYPVFEIDSPSPTNLQRLRAVGTTIFSNSLNRVNTVTKSLPAVIGSVTGDLIYHVNSPSNANPLIDAIGMGLVSAMVLYPFDISITPIVKNKRFNTLLVNSEPGTQIKIDRPGNIKKAWVSGRKQEREKYVFIKPDFLHEGGYTRTMPIHPLEIALHKIIALRKGLTLHDEGRSFSVILPNQAEDLLTVEVLVGNSITTLRPRVPNVEDGSQIIHYSQIVSTLDEHRVSLFLYEGSVIKNPDSKRYPYIQVDGNHNKVTDLKNSNDTHALTLFDRHMAILERVKRADGFKLRTYNPKLY